MHRLIIRTNVSRVLNYNLNSGKEFKRLNCPHIPESPKLINQVELRGKGLERDAQGTYGKERSGARSTLPRHAGHVNFGPVKEFRVPFRIEMTNTEAARDALIERFLAMDALARGKSRTHMQLLC